MKNIFSYLLCCNYNIFYFLRKLHEFPLKINPSYSSAPLWNQNFLTYHNRFFTKIFLPHFGIRGAHVMTLPNQLAPKQITNLQNTTAWLQNSAKTSIKRPIQRLQTQDLRKQESIKNISNWVETDASAQSSF